MNEVIDKLKEWKSGMVKQFNHINNSIARKEQDKETRATLSKIAGMIADVDYVVEYLEN